MVQVVHGGDAGEDQQGVQAAFDSGDHVGVHAVSDHDGVVGVDAQHTKACAHHQGIGFAYEIGGFAGCQFDGRDEGTAGGYDSEFGGTGQVGVGAD